MPRSRLTRPVLERRRSGMGSPGCAARIFAAAAIAMAAGSCAADPTAPVPAAGAGQLFWAVTLDHEAVTLSVVPPYDTLQLHATARSSSGAVLTDAPAPHFVSTDAERVQVDGAGVLHAIKPGTNIVVVAVDTVDDIVHADSVRVTVTTAASPPVLATLTFPQMDSAKFALGGTIFGDSPGPLTVQARDGNGNVIDGLAVHYSSSNPRVASIDPVTGVPTLRQVGHVTFAATATAFGITKTDTLAFIVGLPVLLPANIMQTVVGGDSVITVSSPATIAVGGTVVWINNTGVPTVVTFDDPASAFQDDLLCQLLSPALCGSGNTDAFVYHTGDAELAWRARQFRAPGTYRYHIGSFTGTIIVQRD